MQLPERNIFFYDLHLQHLPLSQNATGTVTLQVRSGNFATGLCFCKIAALFRAAHMFHQNHYADLANNCTLRNRLNSELLVCVVLFHLYCNEAALKGSRTHKHTLHPHMRRDALCFQRPDLLLIVLRCRLQIRADNRRAHTPTDDFLSRVY